MKCITYGSCQWSDVTWLFSVALTVLSWVNLRYNHKWLFFCVCGVCKSCLERIEPTAKKKKEKREEKKYNRIQQEINVLLIMFKTMYDMANFTPFHKINTTREWYLTRETTTFFNLSWN